MRAPNECTMVNFGSSKAAYFYRGQVPLPNQRKNAAAAAECCCPIDDDAADAAAASGKNSGETNSNNKAAATMQRRRGSGGGSRGTSDTTGKATRQNSAAVAVHSTTTVMGSGMQYYYYYDPYQLLHLRRDATAGEIKQAYRRLAVLRHPSRCCQGRGGRNNNHDTAAALQFAAVAAAYETLSVAETRQRMDSILFQGISEDDGGKDANQTTQAAVHHLKQERDIRKKLQQERRLEQQQRKEAERKGTKKKGVRKIVSAAVRKSVTPTNSTTSKRRDTAQGTAVVPRSDEARSVPPPPLQVHVTNSVPSQVSGASSLPPPAQVSTFLSSGEDDGDGTETLFSGDEANTAFSGDEANATFSGDEVNTTFSGGELNTFSLGHEVTNTDADQATLDDEHLGAGVNNLVVTASGGCGMPPLHIFTGCLGANLHVNESSDEEGENIILSGGNSRNSRTKHSIMPSKRNGMKRRLNAVPSLPALVQSSSSSASTTNEDVQHYSAATTERLFGGPLQLMYRARRWQSFTDPHEIFERVFGSSLVGQSNNTSKGHQKPSSPAAVVVVAPAPSAWTGSTETLVDGTIISTNCRVTQNQRLMTRTVTRFPPDSVTGQSRTTVAVTSEDLAIVEEDSSSSPGRLGCLIGCSSRDTKQKTAAKMPGSPRKKQDMDDSATAATAMEDDDDWSLSSACQYWLPTCCSQAP